MQEKESNGKIEFIEPEHVEGEELKLDKGGVGKDTNDIGKIKGQLEALSKLVQALSKEVVSLKGSSGNISSKSDLSSKEILDVGYILKCKSYKERLDYMNRAITFGGISEIKMPSINIDRSTSRRVELVNDNYNEVQLFRHMFLDKEYRLLKVGIDLVIGAEFSNFSILCNLLKELNKTSLRGIFVSLELDNIVIDTSSLEVFIQLLNNEGEVLKRLRLSGINEVLTKMLYERLRYNELELDNKEYGWISAKAIRDLITYYKGSDRDLRDCAITGSAIIVKEGSEDDLEISNASFKACKVSREY